MLTERLFHRIQSEDFLLGPSEPLKWADSSWYSDITTAFPDSSNLTTPILSILLFNPLPLVLTVLDRKALSPFCLLISTYILVISRIIPPWSLPWPPPQAFTPSIGLQEVLLLWVPLHVSMAVWHYPTRKRLYLNHLPNLGMQSILPYH